MILDDESVAESGHYWFYPLACYQASAQMPLVRPPDQGLE